MGLHLNVIREPDENCLKCGLHKKCNHPIMNGEGSEKPVWFFVGEAPGAKEDELGIPFTGKEGSGLRDEIEMAKFEMEKCRFSNSVRCRPPENKIGEWPDAPELCQPKILREIHVTNPKVVILLGAYALKSVLGKTGIVKLNGEIFRRNGRYYVPCVHPGYVLRNPEAIGKFRKSLKIAYRLGQKSHSPEKLTRIVVQTKQDLYEFTDLLKKWPEPVAHDIEGASLSTVSRTVKPRSACMSWSWDPTTAVLFATYGRVGWENKIKVHPEEMLEAIKEIYESQLGHILHFGKYDAGYMQMVHGIVLRNYWYDTGLASYALDERKGIHNLDDWSHKVGMGGHKAKLSEYLSEHPEAKQDMCLIHGDILYPYNMDDSIATLRVFNVTYPKLKKEGLYHKPFRFPLMYHNWTAQQMEMTGVKLDLDYNAKLMQTFPDKIETLGEEIKQYSAYTSLCDYKLKKLVKSTVRRVDNYVQKVPHPEKKVLELVQVHLKAHDLVNLDGDDKRDLVYRFGGYKPRYTTGSGLPSVKMEYLEEMQLARPSPMLDKLIVKGKYQSSFNKYVNPIDSWAGTDGRTHTSYLPHGNITGRVSSQDPNHENFPKRYNGDLEKELVTQLRTQFRATNDDYILAESDEKQIEMRLFCDRAHDDVMLEEFLAFKDPHAMGAQAGFRYTEKEWLALPEDRRKALRNRSKNAISFGLLYGRSVKALAADMGWSLRRAQKFVDRYFGKYDDCLAYRETVEEFVMAHKYVESFFGRRRRLPDVDSEDWGRRNQALRQAINAPIQGDASDITWCAGYRLSKFLQKYRMKSKVIIAVHDALYVDIYRKELMDVLAMKYFFLTDRKWIEKRTGWYCTVPLDIDISLGPNLGHMVELKRITQGEFDYEIPAALAA